MAVKPNFNQDYLYFVTTTAVSHHHIFVSDNIKHILLESFSFMRENNWIKLYAFVIMPNHLHIILRVLHGRKLFDVMRDFKKFTSKRIVQRLETENNLTVLSAIQGVGRRGGNKVWEDGYDARDIFTAKFLKQKLDYIHLNPSQPHWNLVEHPEDYVWSSARYYLHGQKPIIKIDDVMEFLA